MPMVRHDADSESEAAMGGTSTVRNGGGRSGKPDTSSSDGHRDKPPGQTRPYEPKPPAPQK
jgi:hypothetical protein